MISLTEENKEIIDKLKDLDSKIDRLKKEAFVGLEDQLFFGVIIALLILFVTLPINDLGVFFQNTFGLGQDEALNVAGTIRYLGIVIFLVSTLARYYAVISNQNTAKRSRHLSIEMLILAFNTIVLVVVVNLVPIFGIYIGPFGLSMALFVLVILYIIMIPLEKRILKIYANKGFIFKKDTTFPYASLATLIIVLAICIAVLEEALAILVSFGFSSTRFLITYVLVATLWIILVFMRGKIIKPKKKQRGTKLTDYTK